MGKRRARTGQRQNTTRIAVVAAVALVAVVVVVIIGVVTTRGDATGVGQYAAIGHDIDARGLPRLGDPNAPVVVEELGDFT
jgi:hypothetical protein